MADLTAAIVQCLAWDYGIQLSHIFEILVFKCETYISIEKLGISNQKF